MIPKKFNKNETIVIVAGGPSLLKEDVEYCVGKARIAVVNDAYRLIPSADILYAADKPWWDKYTMPHLWKDGKKYPSVLEYPAEKFTQDDKAAAAYKITWVKGKWGAGISIWRDFIHYGHNSGFQCCNLVYLMGAKRILLLGFDMKRTNKKLHWFGDHPKDLHKHSDYGKWANVMDKAAPKYEKAGVEVINCSRDTALKGYKRGIITDCL